MLAPLLVGIVVRAIIPGMWRLLDAARPVSRLLQQACLVATPWMSISVYADQLGDMHPSALVAAAAAAAVLHIVLLLFNTVAASILRLGGSLPRPAARVRRPVILASSQKTLPVSVAVLDQLGGALGAPGLVERVGTLHSATHRHLQHVRIDLLVCTCAHVVSSHHCAGTGAHEDPVRAAFSAAASLKAFMSGSGSSWSPCSSAREPMLLARSVIPWASS